MRVQTDEKVGIGGFIVTGSTPKTVIVRAIGPTLAAHNITGALPDPVLELHGSGEGAMIINDNWKETQEEAIRDTGLAPADDLESAIVATLEPGNYTAIVRGKEKGAGIALVEIYDVGERAASRLSNLSTRAFVGTGEDLVIAGFLLSGDTASNKLVLRGIAPSLSAELFPVNSLLANPTLELRDSNGALVEANDNWGDDAQQAAEISGAGLAPAHHLESGLAAMLPPGLYTVLLSGVNDGVGVGVVELYDLGPCQAEGASFSCESPPNP
jgi:hypothetical protein